MRALTLVVLFTFPVAAYASSPASFPAETRIDFGSEEIAGGTLASQLETFTQRKASHGSRLIKLRAHFRSEILQSISHH